MNRKQWIIIGIIITVLLVVGYFLLRINRSDDGAETSESISVDLAYCTEEEVKPCVVSFSLDVDGNMLVNILLPDLTYPGFYLEIMRGEVSVSYSCKRIAATPNNAYCIGEKLPPGESLYLRLISTRDNLLLAQGELSIIGLAFPTLEIAIPTDVPTETPIVETSTPTEFPDFIIPTATQSQPPTRTKAPPSYPNPSYP